MADTYLKLNYTLVVDDKDMRLICLGLAGQLKRPEDIKAAQELNVRLLRAQSIRIGEQAAKINGALQKAQEAAGGPDPVGIKNAISAIDKLLAEDIA